jgi:predicted ABC-type ATPase
VKTTEQEILPFFVNSTLLQNAELDDEAAELRFHDGKLDFFSVSVNSYFASVAADFLRQKLLEQRTSFSFETVMSSPDKVTLLAKAQKMGYRTYLYYVATDDPEINLARVKARVRQGGHDVPPDKIRSRYFRSLDLLLDAIRATDRAYLFDNSRSGGEQTWIAEITGGHDLTIRTNSLTPWFQRAVWDKIEKPTL